VTLMNDRDRKAEVLAIAVGRLLDGPTDDATGAMDEVISAYDAWYAALA
jgi:hypothetical protein